MATAVTSLSGMSMISNASELSLLLLMYIADRGVPFGRRRDSMRVQDPFIGDDSVMSDQYCSCSINMVYFDELGSFRMLCVRD